MKFDTALSKSVTRHRKDETSLHDVSGEWSVGLNDMLDFEKKDMGNK